MIVLFILALLPSIANRKAKYLDEPDARRLLELLREEPIKWRAIVTFDLLSGLRRGELAGLRWQDAQREKLGDAWQDKDGRVFTGDDGAPMFPDSISQWFAKFVKRTGLPKVTVHSLRHTYASIMIADGTPLVVVSHQLGHAQASTTANIYAHVIASAEARAAQTFDRFNDIITPAGDTPHTPDASPKRIEKIG